MVRFCEWLELSKEEDESRDAIIREGASEGLPTGYSLTVIE